jgi:hypothetical protein
VRWRNARYSAAEGSHHETTRIRWSQGSRCHGQAAQGLVGRYGNVGDVVAKSLDGADLTLSGSSVEAFAASLRGDLLLQG